ncbi:MAG TPA: NifU family protein [Gemmatimonadaceae bacterium]|nr:NifU family protein [Gemmatimonadaceae bacterium]
MPVFRRKARRSASDVENRIRAALDSMRPLLRVEDFDIELVRFDAAKKVAHLRVEGGCPDCDMTAATLTKGIEAHLRQRVPEVETVEADSTDKA